jgi:hypothetical protein
MVVSFQSVPARKTTPTKKLDDRYQGTTLPASADDQPLSGFHQS